MKDIFFAVILSLSFLKTFSQNFPGYNPELLINKTVKPIKIMESLQEYGYSNFYLEFDTVKKQFTKDYEKNRPFPISINNNIVSDYNKLVGREFKVLEIYKIDTTNSFLSKDYAIKIENAEIGTLFFRYNPKFTSEIDFELEIVGGLNYPEDFFCSEIKSQKDRFTDKETFYTPAKKYFRIIKYIENSITTIYLQATVSVISLKSSPKGLYFIFEDGTKLYRKDAEVIRNIEMEKLLDMPDYYFYSSTIKLKDSEIQKLTEKKLTDVRVDNSEILINEYTSEQIKGYFNCLTK